MTIDPNKVGAWALDLGAALVLFLARGYAFWMLSLIALPALPVMGVTYTLGLEHVYALFGMLAVWHGLQVPGEGSWRSAGPTIALYVAIASALVWAQGTQPHVPSVFDGLGSVG